MMTVQINESGGETTYETDSGIHKARERNHQILKC